MLRLPIALFLSLIAVNVYSIENSMQNCPKYHSNSLLNKTLESGAYLINSDQSSVTNKNIFQLNGNVEVTSKDYFFGADTMSLNSDKKEFYGEGNVLFENDYIFLDGRNLLVENDILSGTELQFNLKEDGVNGFAKKIIADSDIKTFEKVNFSKCPIGSNDWSISASSLTVDEERNIGVVDDLVFEFIGVPIFYSPYLDWPLEGRGSGFLAPSFSSYTDPTKNTSEQKIKIPYYFNLAQDKDLLIDFDYLSSRGLGLGSLYRQLLPKGALYESGRVELNNKVLFSDKVTKKDRWLSKNYAAIDINPNSKINLNTYRVSDAEYFNELEQNSTEKNLISSISYNYDKNNLLLDIIFENEQIMSGGTTSYLNHPKINIEKKFLYENNVIDLSLIGSKLKNKNSALIEANRFHSKSSISKDIYLNKFFVRPTLSLLNSKYSLSNNENHTRSLAKLNVVIDSELERKISSKNGNNFIQTFTPKLAYNYVENKLQNQIPNFDSEPLGLNSENIYYSDQFTSFDRISGDNSLTYGFNTGIYNEKTGEKYFDLSLGQKYRLDNLSTNIDGEVVSQNTFSDIYLDGSFNYKNNSLVLSHAFDTYKNKTNRLSMNYSYLGGFNKVFGFNFINDGDKHIALNSVFPINERIHLLGSLSKNLNDKSKRGLFGLGYRTCCWEARIVKFDSSNNLSEKSLNFELVFKDLASSSPSLQERIKEQIPNYLHSE